MKLWRIAAETRKYTATDLSGGGAAANPGRWNDDSEPAVYCAPTIAIAVLETAAHIDIAGLPLNRFLVEIDVPDNVWSLHEKLEIKSLPQLWSAIPAGRASVALGSSWLKQCSSPVLLVPSVIVPEEWAALINPAHAASTAITAKVIRYFEFNRLFRP